MRLGIIFFFIFNSLFAEQEIFQHVKINLDGNNQIKQLYELGIALDHYKKNKDNTIDIILSESEKNILIYHDINFEVIQDDLTSYFVPAGFAQGFQTMTSNCEMLYLHTEDYNKSSEGAINALDPMINIKWPKPITMRSTRDISHAMLTENFKGIEL